MPVNSNAQLAQLMADLIGAYQAHINEYATWLSGSATGGAGADGIFPLTDLSGNVSNVKAPARLQLDVDGQVSSAETFKDDAETAETSATASAASALAEKIAAESARDAAVAARDLADTYKDDAAASEANASGSASAAATSEANAATSETNAATSETNAATSETNAAASAAAALASEIAAATFDPALYAALADGETITGLWDFTTAPTISGNDIWHEGNLDPVGLAADNDFTGSVSFSDMVHFTNSPASSIDGSILMEAAAPILAWLEVGSPTDEKVWDIVAYGEQMLFRTANDAGAGNVNFMVVDRTGTAIDAVGFPAGKVTIGGAPATQMLNLTGPNGSTAGPHVLFTTASDIYPLFQILPFTHDNISLAFDAHWNGTIWASGDPTSNFQIYKLSDKLRFQYGGPKAVGTGVSWSEGLTLDAFGLVEISSVLRILGAGDASLTSTLHGFQVGPDAGNVIIDGNEIMARTSGTKATLFMNADGGDVNFGNVVGMQLVGPSGTSALPTYSFHTDPDTGIYRVSEDNLGIVVGASRLMRFIKGTPNLIVIDAAAQLRIENGTAGAPGLGFADDSNTGMFRITTDRLGFSTAGVQRLEINAASHILSSLRIQGPNGTQGLPTYTFSGDTNSGMYWSSADVLGFSAGAARRMALSTAELVLDASIDLRMTAGGSYNTDPNRLISMGYSNDTAVNNNKSYRWSLHEHGIASGHDLDIRTSVRAGGTDIVLKFQGIGGRNNMIRYNAGVQEGAMLWMEDAAHSSGGQVTVSTSAPSGGNNGDIWLEV